MKSLYRVSQPEEKLRWSFGTNFRKKSGKYAIGFLSKRAAKNAKTLWLEALFSRQIVICASGMNRYRQYIRKKSCRKNYVAY